MRGEQNAARGRP